MPPAPSGATIWYGPRRMFGTSGTATHHTQRDGRREDYACKRIIAADRTAAPRCHHFCDAAPVCYPVPSRFSHVHQGPDYRRRSLAEPAAGMASRSGFRDRSTVPTHWTRAPDFFGGAILLTDRPQGDASPERPYMQTTEAAPQSRWRLLREAIAGTHQDFTQGSLSRGIALLAIPTILELAMESTFGVVDAFWVAKLGPDAMSAVGLTEALIVLVFAVAMGFATAATATIARRTGEKDPEGASVAAVQGIASSILTTALLGVAGYFAAPQLLAWMRATPGTIAIGTTYARIVLGGNYAIVMIFVINGIFRGAGDAATAMRTLWLANLINL